MPDAALAAEPPPAPEPPVALELTDALVETVTPFALDELAAPPPPEVLALAVTAPVDELASPPAPEVLALAVTAPFVSALPVDELAAPPAPEVLAVVVSPLAVVAALVDVESPPAPVAPVGELMPVAEVPPDPPVPAWRSTEEGTQQIPTVAAARNPSTLLDARFIQNSSRAGLPVTPFERQRRTMPS